MAVREVHLQQVLGAVVRDRKGRRVGRLEEVRAEAHGAHLEVTEWHLGSYAAFERLAAWSIGRAVLNLFGAAGHAYRVPWDKLDLKDVKRPVLRCPVSDLGMID
jgi:hypothetical protein